MAEVQQHGNQYEDRVIRELTGLSKKEYDNLKKNGYTSPMDLVKGLKVDFDGSIKTAADGNDVCFSDARRMTKHTEFRSYIGIYTQVDKNHKHFHTEYVFYFTPDNIHKLWKNNDVKVVHEYAEKISSIDWKDNTKVLEYREKYKKSWLQELNWDDSALIRLRPKVNHGSGNRGQSRLQCAMRLDSLLESGINYDKRSIDYTVVSGRRKFKKK